MNQPQEKILNSPILIEKYMETESVHHKNDKKNALYFMKGNQSLLLNNNQQKQIFQIFQQCAKENSIFVYNSSQLHRIYADFRKNLSWIKPHYAVKTNPRQQILKDLIQLGSNFDCASKNQMLNVFKLGAKPNQIVYSNPVKDQKQLQWAGEQGVQLTVADSVDQVVKILEYAPRMSVLWRIAIKQMESQQRKTHFSQKFGDDLEDDMSIRTRMHELKLQGISLKGIHFHCGSKNMGTPNFARAIQLARRCMQIGRQYGHQMSILDIGSGFPSGQIPQSTINDLKPTQTDPLNYTVIAQPGRRFSSNCFYVITKVFGRRVKNQKVCYHINDSLYHSFNNVLTDGISFNDKKNEFYSKICMQTHQINKLQKFKQSTLFGMTCDGIDVIATNIQVPEQLRCGDWICIGGMGAYTYSLKTNFNGMESTVQIKTWRPQKWEFL